MKHYLIFINGMTPFFDAHDWKEEYLEFWDGVTEKAPELKDSFKKNQLVFVQWGHPIDANEISIKAELQRAQKYIWNNMQKPKSFWTRTLDWISSGLGYSQKAKFENFLPGLGDVLWANTVKGKRLIRVDFLDAMMKAGVSTEEKCHLHFVSHSYGVTLAFDFIRDLFSIESIDEEPRSCDITGNHKRYWESLRKSVINGQLKFGSLGGMASQLPLSVTRHQRMLNALANQSRISLQCFGGIEHDQLKIKFFYDPEDLLGFQSSILFEECSAIKDIRVNTGLLPIKAHNDYWKLPKVHSEFADLLTRNLLL